MKRFIFSCLILLLVIPSSVMALVGNDFTIKVAIGDDITPPSTPTLQSVTPIATTQIDLSWSTSTDNWILGGYVVLRDNNQIATTTLTSYNDTGLSAETLYTYEIYAFDSAGNISSTSNALATTTLPVIATTTPPVVTNPTSSGAKVLILRDLKIEAERNSATLIWETNRTARYILRWGRTALYTGGYIENESYRTTQQTTITDLEPGTLYLYELVGITPNGVATTLKTGQFTTGEEMRSRVVQNVERLTATVVQDIDVRLDYQLPITESGAKVRILRSHLGFPTDIYDGVIVYEGTKNSIYDESALLDNKKQYYTVFVIGSEGTISSGAVVVANRQGTPSDIADTDEETQSQTATSSKPDIVLPLLTLDQIVIKQNDKQQTFFDENLTLSYLEPFIISIAKDTLPDHLKSIVVTLLDPTDQRRSYSFLLRINKTGTAYEAVVSALRVLGTSRLTIEVFDFEQLIVGRYRKQIDFIAPERLKEKEKVFFPDTMVVILDKVWPWLVILFGVFIIWWFFVWRRKDEVEDKE